MSDGSPHTAAASQIIEAVAGAIRANNGLLLLGLYLCGSLATGDFDEEVSDIDMLAVLSSEVSPDLVASLERALRQLADNDPKWRNRIEVLYVSAAALATFRRAPPRIAVISPGEPLHLLDAGPEWVITWYPARRYGIALAGPHAKDLIPEIAFAEYVNAVRSYLLRFRERIPEDATPGSQAFAVLTMCRGLYTCLMGEPASKLRAAAWAQQEFPEWAGLIGEAITWRQHQWEVPQPDGTATVPTVRRFIADIAQRVGNGRR